MPFMRCWAILNPMVIKGGITLAEMLMAKEFCGVFYGGDGKCAAYFTK